MTTTWFLVADQSRVRVIAPKNGSFLEVRAFDAPRVRESATSLMSGGPGRHMDQGGPGQRSALERRTSVQDTEILPFVHEVCDWLHVARARNAFDDLVIIAEPRMVGLLRKQLATHANLHVADTLSRNVTSEPFDVLVERIRESFPEHLPAVAS